MRRLLATLVVLGAWCSAFAGPVSAQDSPAAVVERRGGGDRAATAVAVSQALFPCTEATACASSVVLVGAASSADALIAGPLVARWGAPVLFVGEDGPSAGTLDEVARLGVDSVTVVGGPASVTDEALEGLRARGVRVTRVAGRDRYETAVAVAGLFPGAEVALASGSEAHLVDAAVGGALAAALDAPLLLGERESLPPATAAALDERRPRRVTLVGGESALSRAVEALVGERSDEVERVAGRDRIQTSFAVAARARDHGAGLGRVWAAAASATADQLVASSAAGVTGTVVVLVAQDPQGGLAGQLRLWLAERRRLVSSVELVGGVGVISDATVQGVTQSLAAGRSEQIALSVETERERYARGERVQIRASACNVGDQDIVREISGGLSDLFILDARGTVIAQTREDHTTGFSTYRLKAGECEDLSREWDPTMASIGEFSAPEPISGESPAPPGPYRVRLDWNNISLPPHAPIYSEPFLITVDE